MAKKKKSIELSSKNIEYVVNNVLYKIIRFKPASMCVDVMVFEPEVTKGIQKELPFAHLPKEIKKLIKPN